MPQIGFKHSEESKQKNRIAHLGKIISSETRKKLSIAMKGKQNSKGTKRCYMKRVPMSEERKQKHREIALKLGIKPPAPQKGVRLSAITIQKLKSRIVTKETRVKIAEANKGEKSHFWKGGLTEKNKSIRNGIEFRLWREAVFSRDNWTCQICFIRGGKLHPDHIKPFSLFPELRFAIDNGRTLCVDCHKNTDTYGGKMIGKTRENFN